MIVDSSALVAILRGEEDAERYARALAASARSRLSAATYLEVGIVIDGHRDPVLSRTLDALLQTAAVEIVELIRRHRVRATRQCFDELPQLRFDTFHFLFQRLVSGYCRDFHVEL